MHFKVVSQSNKNACENDGMSPKLGATINKTAIYWRLENREIGRAHV